MKPMIVLKISIMSIFSFRWVSCTYESESNEAERKKAMLYDQINELILFFEYWVSSESKCSLKMQERIYKFIN